MKEVFVVVNTTWTYWSTPRIIRYNLIKETDKSYIVKEAYAVNKVLPKRSDNFKVFLSKEDAVAHLTGFLEKQLENLNKIVGKIKVELKKAPHEVIVRDGGFEAPPVNPADLKL